MNLTITADLNYPNNKLSEFYCLLNEDIKLFGKNQVAILEFFYPVNYIVNLGFIELSYPSYILLDNKEVYDIKKVKNIIENIYKAQNDIESELNNFWLNKIELDTVKIDFLVKTFEENINLYIQFVRRFSKEDKDIQFLDFFHKLNNFYNNIKNYHSSFEYEQQVKTSEYDFSFLVKVIGTVELLVQKFDIIDQNINKHIKFEINFPDRISKEEFTNCLVKIFGNLCYLENKSLKLKSFVEVINCHKILLDYINIRDQKVTILKNLNYVSNFLIFTDIISDTIGSGDHETILRYIKPEGKHGDENIIVFDKPHFETINKTRLTKVFIKITDQYKKLINFQSGNIILKLEIRKK